MKTKTFTTQDVDHFSKLAAIPLSDSEKEELAHGFTTVIAVLDTLKNIDVAGVPPTSQVTGLENVWREDEVDVTRMFTQEAAIRGANRTYNGFFVVDQVIAQED